MLTGWIKPFKINRKLTGLERNASFEFNQDTSAVPGHYSSLIHLNSTYIDFIGRDYRLRGMLRTSIGILIHFGIFAFQIFLNIDFFSKITKGGDNFNYIVGISFTNFCFFVIFFVSWMVYLRKEFFAYRYYPIRFNRKTRNVHVFRNNGPGGVLTVPWEQVYWHIGQGQEQTYLRDLRGHVLDGKTVKDTFAVGHYFDDTQLDRIQGMWEFIRRYMEYGPESVVDDPRDRFVDLSMTPSWRNCYLWVVISLGAGMHALRFVLLPIVYPFYWFVTSVRWLVFNTSKEPVWPPEIVAESRIEPNDPNVWEEPNYIGEFANRPGVLERALQKANEQAASRARR